MNDNIRAALVNVIKASRQKLSRVQRQKVKPQRWLYPLAAEKRYGAAIRAWLRPIKDYVQTYLKENQEAILRGDAADDSIQVTRLDAVPGKSFKTMIDSLNGWLGQYVPDDDASKSGSPIYLGLGRLADSVFDFNEGQFEKGAKTVLGVEFPVGEIWWPDARDTWANKNYDLIRSDMKKHIGQINDLTEKAVTSGLSVRTLTQQILALDNKLSKHRANFIARDQIGKLNGQITQRRMEECGLELYVWETSGDERVRGNPGGKYPDAKPSHHAMDGRLCRWDDASVYSEDGGKTWKDRGSDAVHLHPGMDYQCRCTATAYWQELVGEADAQIDQIDQIEGIADNNSPSPEPQNSTMTKQQEEENLKSILGIDKVKTTNISAEVLHEINDALTKILNEFPQLKGVIQQVKVTTDKSAGTAAFNVKYKNGVITTALTLNSNDLTNPKAIAKMIEDNVSAGNWTPKDGVGGIIRHEMAHALEFIQTFNERGVDFTGIDANGIIDRHSAFKAYGRHEVADRVVHQAQTNLGMRYAEWVNLCDYASNGGIGEGFAEAMSDASGQKLSKEVVNIARRGFK